MSKSISMKCNMHNMLRQAKAAIDPKRDRYGSAASGIEMLMEHIEQVRSGEVPIEEFARFYMLTPQVPA